MASPGRCRWNRTSAACSRWATSARNPSSGWARRSARGRRWWRNSTRCSRRRRRPRAEGARRVHSVGEARTRQRGGELAGRAEAEGDGHGPEADPERADVEPEVAAERVVQPAAGPRPEGHAQGGHESNSAEDGPHDPLAEVLAHEDRVERHHAAIGEAEHQRERIEARGVAREEVEAHGDRLQREPADQHALGADPVGHEAAEDLAAERGEAGRGEHGGGRNRRHAVVDRVGDHVKDRCRVRRATREERQRDGGELRRAQRLRHREPRALGARRDNGGRRQRRRLAHEQRGGNDDEPREVTDHQHGEAPVVARDEPAREGRRRRRPEAEPGRDERDGETAMLREPAGGRRRQRRVEAARREADDDTEEDLELAEGRRLARRHQTEAEQDASAEHDRARAEPIGQRAPGERSDPHAEEIEERGHRDARAGPAHRCRHGRQEHAEREHRPEPDTGRHDPDADDDPAVEEPHIPPVPPSAASISRSNGVCPGRHLPEIVSRPRDAHQESPYPGGPNLPSGVDKIPLSAGRRRRWRRVAWSAVARLHPERATGQDAARRCPCMSAHKGSLTVPIQASIDRTIDDLMVSLPDPDRLLPYERRGLIARYAAVLEGNFIYWMTAARLAVASDEAKAIIEDNLREEVRDHQPGMRRRSALAAHAAPTDSDFLAVYRNLENVRLFVAGLSAVKIVLMMAFFEGFIMRFMPYLADLAGRQGSAERQYTDVHGVCDVVHTEGLFRALEAEMLLKPDVPEPATSLFTGVEVLRTLIQHVIHPHGAI